jgi:hypothetical protein
MNKQQTAVEWLQEALSLTFEQEMQFEGLFQQAKEMEKQQIIDAFWNGDNSDCTSEQNSKEFAEEYYNQTFKI